MEKSLLGITGLVILVIVGPRGLGAETVVAQGQPIPEQGPAADWGYGGERMAPSPAQGLGYGQGYGTGQGYIRTPGINESGAGQSTEYAPAQGYEPWQSSPAMQDYRAPYGYETFWGYGAGTPGGYGLSAATRRLMLIDENRDGMISDDEAAVRHEEAFLTLDADEDGVLTAPEYLAFPTWTQTAWDVQDPRHQARQSRKEQRFRKMDGNGDGRVDKAEFMATGEKHYKAADVDKDGNVSVWEFRAQPHRE